MKRKHVCFISAGEYSGDLLAAELFGHLREALGNVVGFGVTGGAMEAAGVMPVASISEFSYMGFTEIVRHLPDLLELESRILTEIDRRKPEFAILVDFPGFHFRLAEQLRLRGIKVIQYVAPKLWAWGENRVTRLKRDFDLVLGILPFEEKFFLDRGVAYKFVGNPQKDRVRKLSFGRNLLGYFDSDLLLGCLPGSRQDEVNRMVPIIYQIAAEARKHNPKLCCIVPVAPNLGIAAFKSVLSQIDPDAKLMESRKRGIVTWQWNFMEFFPGMSLELMSMSDVAIVTSGTATLECALLGTPMVVVYAMSSMTYEIAKAKITIADFSLVNLIARQRLVNEYIQQIEPRVVGLEVANLADHGSTARQHQKRSFASLNEGLSGNAAATAALEIAEFVAKNRPASRK